MPIKNFIQRVMRPSALTALGVAALTMTELALAQDIRVAHVYDKTGPLEAYAKQTQTGLLMGLEFATGGTMTVAGHKITVIERDTQGKPMTKPTSQSDRRLRASHWRCFRWRRSIGSCC
jgi:ABC-type branched-subunit amino acid transport system substrate-binding protein